MDRWRRVFVLLLLAGTWTTSLLSMAYPARAQAPDGPAYSSDIHVVEPGQTLSAIARQYGTDVKTLLQLNDLENPDLLYAGQKLVVAGGERPDRPAGQNEEHRQTNQDGSSWQEPGSGFPRHPGIAWEVEPEKHNGDGSSVRWAHPDGTVIDWKPEEHAMAGEHAQRPDVTWSSPAEETAPVEEQARDRKPLQPERQVAGKVQQPSAGPSVSWSSPSSGQENDQEDEWAFVSSARQGIAWEAQPSQRSRYSSQNHEREGDAQGGALWQGEATGEKWIDVDLSEQRLVAYQGETVVRVFSISSGAEKTPTVTGSFRIYAKIAEQDMSGGSRAAGDYYFQADVPWVQYFYADYSIHGAYWHNLFGQRTGHGCINMRVDEARWLFEWAEPEMDPNAKTSEGWLFTSASRTGTRVEVHE
jgi:LysM repeat protein